MTINFLAVLACGIWSMILGFIWYGPLFGKKWMQIIGADAESKKEREEMQKSAGPLYGIQFVLSLFQAYVLAYYIAGWQDASGIENALWIWAAFVVPILAGNAMWNNDSKEISWARFLIQAGYQLLLFVSFGFILGTWR